MKGPAVLISAVIRGMEREVNCEVLVRKQSSPSGIDYAEGFIMNAPHSLPDGEYLVTFDRHTLRATKERGQWLTSPIERESKRPSR